MALVFRGGERADGGGRIEIRRAGGTLRLYLGGVLSSQWNPAHALTGGYWDGLGTAALLSPVPCRSALFLGVGGGGAIHVARRVVRPRSIVGVEVDPALLSATRRHFPLDGPDATFVRGDAFAYATRGRRRFDLVADDVYDVVAGEAARPSHARRSWFESLARCLAPQGVLAVNFVDAFARFSAMREFEPVRRRWFPSTFRFTFDAYWNEVIAACRVKTGVARFEAALAGALPRRALVRRRFRVEPFP